MVNEYLVFIDLVQFHLGGIIPSAVAYLVQFQGMLVVLKPRYPNWYVVDLLSCPIFVWLIALVKVFCDWLCVSVYSIQICVGYVPWHMLHK